MLYVLRTLDIKKGIFVHQRYLHTISSNHKIYKGKAFCVFYYYMHISKTNYLNILKAFQIQNMQQICYTCSMDIICFFNDTAKLNFFNTNLKGKLQILLLFKPIIWLFKCCLRSDDRSHFQKQYTINILIS